MLAVADALQKQVPSLRLVFVGTARGIESRVVPEHGYELTLMRIEPMRGGGVSGLLRGAAIAARSVPRGWALIGRLRPRAIFSIGGYAAGPVSLAAWARRVPLALMEPNAVLGLANRLVVPLVTRAYTAFPEPCRHFSPGVVLQSGVPIRAGFQPRPYPRRQRGQTLRVLVLGGSQGAKALNEAVPRALGLAQTPIRVTHQCGRGHEPDVALAYEQLGARDRAEVVSFIADMPGALEQADLVISRSGASAVSEICAVGRPAILVPYPFAAGDHQRRNALALQRLGAGLCLEAGELASTRLAALIDRLAEDPGQLAAMAEQARAFGRPQAAEAIAKDLLDLAGLRATEPLGAAGSQPSDDGGFQCSAAG